MRNKVPNIIVADCRSVHQVLMNFPAGSNRIMLAKHRLHLVSPFAGSQTRLSGRGHTNNSLALWFDHSPQLRVMPNTSSSPTSRPTTMDTPPAFHHLRTRTLVRLRISHALVVLTLVRGLRLKSVSRHSCLISM